MTDYGKEITRTKANRHFELLLQIRQRTHAGIANLLKDDVEALRYYCGRPGANPINEDLAFIFDKVAIQRILDKLEENNSSGVVIFKGVRSKEDSEIGLNTEIYSDIDGRPTLMIFPFTYSTPPSMLNGDPELEVDLDKGTEHPGTGGIGGKTLTQLPSRFNTIDIFKYNKNQVLIKENLKAPLIE